VTTNLELARGRLPRLLLERVQNVDTLGSRRQIEHAVRATDPNPDFSNAWSDYGHGLPVVRFQALLNASELKAGQTPDQAREGTKITP